MREPQAMYLVREDLDIDPCWIVRHCPVEQRENCIAWEYDAGYYCWSINGTFCQGEVHNTWGEKMEVCRQCEVFASMIPKLSDR